MSSDFQLVHRLQSGWWEDVLLVRIDGQRRVRKILHRLDAPWAREVFIKEWRYLRTLPDTLHPPFVRVLASCDELLSDPIPPDRPLWFDMEYLEGFSDVRALLTEGRMAPIDAERIQTLLADALVHRLYQLPGEPFEVDRLIWPVVEQVVDFAVHDPDLLPYALRESLPINGRPYSSLRKTVPLARADARVRQQLDRAPSVKLHGDLFYENVLYRHDPPAIALVDPVSVAGVASGPVVFDRVKFHSWVMGELYVLRHEQFEIRHDASDSACRVEYRWASGDPVLRELERVDLSSHVLAAMDLLSGPSAQAQAVLAAYFHLAMVPNTPMPQRLLRYARATEILASWA